MQGNLFATALIAMVAGTAIIVKIAGQRPSLLAVLGGVVLAPALFAGMVFVTPVCACRCGGSASPEVLAALLAGVVFAAVPRRAFKLSTITTLVVMGLALTMWSKVLAARPGYTGNRDWSAELDRMYAEPALRTASLALRVAMVEHPNAVLDEGWIEQSLVKAVGEYPFDSPPSYHGGSVGFCWHTWLTGIYRLQEYQKGIWCRGGSISDCLDRLEGRERTEPNNGTEHTR